jgi:phosphopantothenoylcysteine synthetase/decarboxylase
MARYPTQYLLVSGAVTAWRASEIAKALQSQAERILLIQTPASRQVVSPLTLSRIQGAVLVDGYLDSVLQPRAPIAPVVFAPCSFNSLNKLAHGIADNLALSICAEMIGRRQPVVVAVSINEGLWQHPMARASVAALLEWGVRVLPPQDDGQGLTLAPISDIVNALAGFGASY